MLIFTIKQFIKNGVHLGHYKWECDYRLSYYLLGLRNSIHIINLYYTLYILKKILCVIYNIGLIHQKILIVNNTNVSQNFKKLYNLWYINSKWVNGLLTNQKSLYLNNKKLFRKYYNLGYKAILPSYVFVSNIKNTGSSIFESIILDIPNSSLFDSNQGFYGILYPINSNDDSFISINMFTKLFIKTLLKSDYDLKKYFSYIKRKKLKMKICINDMNINYNRYAPYNVEPMLAVMQTKNSVLRKSIFNVYQKNFIRLKKRLELEDKGFVRV